LSDYFCVPLAEPLRSCPHGYSLLYVSADGSTWCFCAVPAGPDHQHLDAKLAAAAAEWDALGQRTTNGDPET
jgi:hypothetical protein